MDHGGEAARPTTVESTDLGMAGVVQGGEEHMSTGTFQPSAAAYHNNSTVFTRHVHSVPVAMFHREPSGAYANITEFRRQPGPAEVLLDLQVPDGVVQVHDSSFYSALQPRLGAGRGVVLAALLPGGVHAVHNGDGALQPRPGGGHGEAFVCELPGAGVAAYNDYALQPRPVARHGEVLVDLHPDAAGHGEAFVGLVPGDIDSAYHSSGYYALQARPGGGSGEVFIGLLPDGVGAVFVNSANFTQQTLLRTGRADGIAAMLRDPNLGAEHDASETLADDLGAEYDDPSMATAHLRRLLAFVGIGACSVAVNGLAGGPGSPAAAFHLFVLLLAGLFLVILHVLGV